VLDFARMRVLAVETSTRAGGVALLDNERLVAEYLLDVSVTHSERLLAAIDHVIADAGWAAADLQGLAVAAGPGSFTGLRVGISTVKGLALALGVPVAAVPTLDAMAAAMPWASLPVCPVLQARRNEVYGALYRWDGESVRRESAYLAVSPDELAARLSEPTIVLGDAADAIRSPHARRVPPPRRVPSPACVAILGRARLLLGETVSAAGLAPFYLRPSEAELRRRVAAGR
jgi:tRNA threonylcarbamoyladenosine biosynthesis protein TsaB